MSEELLPSGMTSQTSTGPSASGAVAYLLAARALRDFGDGFVAVLLPVYLLALGFSPFEIGVPATAALLGSALLTLGIGVIGVCHDRQRLLLAGAGLMIAQELRCRRPRRLSATGSAKPARCKRLPRSRIRPSAPPAG